MTERYICAECTGRSGEIHGFTIEKKAGNVFCPYCGQYELVKHESDYERR